MIRLIHIACTDKVHELAHGLVLQLKRPTVAEVDRIGNFESFFIQPFGSRCGEGAIEHGGS